MPGQQTSPETRGYSELLSGIAALLAEGRRVAARSVNAALTTTYWLVGRRLVEHEQHGEPRAIYGSELLKRLARDLQSRLGRGFSERNLEQMQQFYLQWPSSSFSPVSLVLVALCPAPVGGGPGGTAPL
jgi:hypothetical protein